MLFRLTVRPTPSGLLLGIVVVAFWALLWLAFLVQVLGSPQTATRQSGPLPELARRSAGIELKPEA